jgi:hypothetical protein
MTFLYFAYKSGRRWARKRRGPSESAPIYVICGRSIGYEALGRTRDRSARGRAA